MSEFFEIGSPDRVVVGTIGEPGQREFYLQARSGDVLLTLKIEKQQVGALATHLGQLLQDLARPAHLPEDDEIELEAFIEADFVVGTISLAYDATADRVVLLIESRASEDAIADEARFLLTREQAASVAIHGTQLVSSGRPPCPLCGFPLDARGHACPRTNGHTPPTL